MRTDVDYIISLMKEYTPKLSGDLSEEDAAPAAASSDSGDTNARGRKWETGLTRGKANKLGLAGEKWETGITRGHANPVA